MNEFTRDTMKYIVTGAAGFIGGHVAEALLKRSDSVVIIDDLSAGNQEQVDYLLSKGDAVFYKQKVEENLDHIFEKEKPDGVFHLAAQPRVQFTIAEPMKSHEMNVQATVNILDACRRFEVPRFVFSSTCALYGDQEKMPITEEAVPNPLSPYAVHKIVGEYYCKLYTLLYGVETIMLRYFNVYGPRQNPEGAYANLICRFVDKFLKGEVPTINGDGTHTRDYVFVRDIVNANLLAMDTANKEAIGNVFNVTGGDETSVNDIVREIKKYLPTELTPKNGPDVVEPKTVHGDASKIQKMLGWKAEMNLEQGMKETIEYFVTKKAQEGL